VNENIDSIRNEKQNRFSRALAFRTRWSGVYIPFSISGLFGCLGATLILLAGY
jgi:hypothetical protein